MGTWIRNDWQPEQSSNDDIRVYLTLDNTTVKLIDARGKHDARDIYDWNSPYTDSTYAIICCRL